MPIVIAAIYKISRWARSGSVVVRACPKARWSFVRYASTSLSCEQCTLWHLSQVLTDSANEDIHVEVEVEIDKAGWPFLVHGPPYRVASSTAVVEKRFSFLLQHRPFCKSLLPVQYHSHHASREAPTVSLSVFRINVLRRGNPASRECRSSCRGRAFERIARVSACHQTPKDNHRR